MPSQYHAGMLDQRIELQSSTETPDGAGGVTHTWTTYATVWAHIRPMSGRERFQRDSRVEASSNYLVVIRNRSGVKETHRIKWGSRYMNLRFVKDEGSRAAWLEIEAEMGAAA